MRELEPDLGGGAVANGEQGNVLGARTHSDDEIDEGTVVDLELQPGDVSMHHPLTVHGSKPNLSDRRRCGLTIRYMSADTMCSDPSNKVMMLTGDPDPGTPNHYCSWPAYRAVEAPEAYFRFKGCDEWNSRRRRVEEDEAYVVGRPVDQLHADVTTGLEDFVRGLGGKVG